VFIDSVVQAPCLKTLTVFKPKHLTQSLYLGLKFVHLCLLFSSRQITDRKLQIEKKEGNIYVYIYMYIYIYIYIYVYIYIYIYIYIKGFFLLKFSISLISFTS